MPSDAHTRTDSPPNFWTTHFCPGASGTTAVPLGRAPFCIYATVITERIVSLLKPDSRVWEILGAQTLTDISPRSRNDKKLSGTNNEMWQAMGGHRPGTRWRKRAVSRVHRANQSQIFDTVWQLSGVLCTIRNRVVNLYLFL